MALASSVDPSFSNTSRRNALLAASGLGVLDVSLRIAEFALPDKEIREVEVNPTLKPSRAKSGRAVSKWQAAFLISPLDR